GMRRINETDALAAAEINDFAVRQYARSTDCEIVKRHHAAGLAMRGCWLWSEREPFVHRPALVGLEMTRPDPAQTLWRRDASQGVAIEMKHFSKTGVKHQRFVAQHKKLIEGETGGRRDVRHIGREPVDAVGDFADFRFHIFLRINQ